MTTGKFKTSRPPKETELVYKMEHRPSITLCSVIETHEWTQGPPAIGERFTLEYNNPGIVCVRLG